MDEGRIPKVYKWFSGYKSNLQKRDCRFKKAGYPTETLTPLMGG